LKRVVTWDEKAEFMHNCANHSNGFLMVRQNLLG